MNRKADTEEKRRKIEIDADTQDDLGTNDGDNSEQNDEPFRFEDRRHWVHPDEEPTQEATPRAPTMIDEYRDRTEAAEKKLQEEARK